VVIYLLARHPAPTPALPPKPEVAQKPPVEDKPITVVDPSPPPQPVPAPQDPSVRSPPPSAPRPRTRRPRTTRCRASKKSRRALQRSKRSHAARAASVDRTQHGGNAQASQAAILAVVTPNRRALNLCYDASSSTTNRSSARA